MKKYLCLFCFAIIVCFSCSNETKNTRDKSYETQKANLIEKEKNNPLVFLKMSAIDKKNIIGQTVVKGTVTNTATAYSYKNVRIKTLYYKDEKVVEEHEDVVDDIIKPNTSKGFKLRYHLPKGTDSVALNIMSAEINDNKSK
ncbi:MAG: hypothetical protein ACR2FN_12035 [Chitinophagaceae bacterium]